MMLNSVRLEGFRNYGEETVALSPGINVITGENAQGKTNFLESIFLLSCGHGFRTRFDSELISFDRSFAHVTGNIFSHERMQHIDISMHRGARKQILVNGVKKNSSELSELLRVVLFCPDDLNMIKDGAAARRRFMDIAISQLRPTYLELMSEYTKLYEHKKRILSDWHDKPCLLDMLDDFSDSLCKCSARIIQYRASFARRLAEAAIPIHSDFSGSGEELSIAYQTVSTISDTFVPVSELYKALVAHQVSHREAEIASGNVLTGIHKDDLDISIDGKNARLYASQGQTRTAALSLKMAEREISLQDTNEYPVLLLDDVLSELDSKRQEYVLNRIGGGQTLITCCEDEQIKARTGGKVITVAGGRIV